nr:MAG TPA: hypothetical protein [Caudoviricetes sp.]
MIHLVVHLVAHLSKPIDLLGVRNVRAYIIHTALAAPPAGLADMLYP